MSKCKWKVIKGQYLNQQELIDLLLSTSYVDLAKQWNCHVDVVYKLRKNLGIGQKRTDVNEFLKKYSKEQLEDLYVDKYDRHLLKMAEDLNVYHNTLSKIFEYLKIEQKPHHVSESPEWRQMISNIQKERSKTENLVDRILQDPDWRDKADKARVKAGTGRQPHKINRKIKDIDADLLKQEVKFRGVLEAAKYFNLSQNTLRKWCKDNNVELVEGPRKARTETEEYKKASRARGVLGLLSVPRKNTNIEIILQNELKARKIVFNLEHKLLDRTVPDAFIEPNIAIYVDGCYFHACPIHGSTSKIGLSRQPVDLSINFDLENNGYKVFRIWEHDVKKPKLLKAFLDKIGLQNGSL